MKTFDLRGVIVEAEDLVDGILVNPVLPESFDATDNKERPFEHAVWWGVPFVRTHRMETPTQEFLREFPEGTEFELRCLDGGAWDRSTWWGRFPSMTAAAAFARSKPAYILDPITVFPPLASR